MRGRSKPRQPSNEPSAQEPVSLQLIADKLERLIWRKRLWGVDERQVWHVVSRLDEMYRQLYREQQVRYEALLAQARDMPVSPPESPAPRRATQQAPRQPQTQTQPSAFQPVPGVSERQSREVPQQPLREVPEQPNPYLQGSPSQGFPGKAHHQQESAQRGSRFLRR